MVMEYMQYGFIALGLATILVAAFVYYRVKVRRVGDGGGEVTPARLLVFLTACGRVGMLPPLTGGESQREPPPVEMLRHCSKFTLHQGSLFFFNKALDVSSIFKLKATNVFKRVDFSCSPRVAV